MSTENYSLDSTNTVGCGCAGCQSGANSLDSIEQNNAQNSSAENSIYAPANNANPNDFANYLTDGYWNDRGGSSFSFSQDNITFSITNDYTAAQANGIRNAFDMWSDIADITFTEVNSGGNIAVTTNSQGRAYSQSSTSAGYVVSNNISIDTSTYGWRNFDDLGDYALMTAMHEIGHSLGLGHTGNYNGSASYGNDAQWANDTHQTTIMSYFSDSNVGSDHFDSTGVWQYSATPMLIDILAIQNIYGADYTTRSTDTTYGFNSNAGRDQYDFTKGEAPFAIWDGGGNDTIDASGYSQNQTLYLTEGDFSSTGYMTNNIVIAYGAEIENAIGGSGHDNIYGNDLNNILFGNAGDDLFYGSIGNDTIEGGAGDDAVTYFSNISDFAFNFISNTVVAITNMVENFTDTISDVENYIFGGDSYSMSDLEESFGSIERITLQTFWNNGDYIYRSETNEEFSLTADDLGYAEETGNQFDLARNNNDFVLTVENNNAPDVIRITGSDRTDNISINGSHNGLTTQIYAGDGADTIEAYIMSTDKIFGEGGDDVIFSGDGNDRISGGTGNDRIFGGAGGDRLIGDEGDDIIYGDSSPDFENSDDYDGNDRLEGGDGNDTLYGEGGRDKLYGGDGVDELHGGDDNDYLSGMSGNDILLGGDGNDGLDGGDGNDELNGGNGNDSLVGGDGNDFLEDIYGLNRLYGGNGDDTLIAGGGYVSGGDDLVLDLSRNKLFGGAGDDRLFAMGGRSTLYGEEGNDEIHGSAYNDLIHTGTGYDTVYAGAGHDKITLSDSGFVDAGAGNDKVYTGTGGGIVRGGDGNDLIIGGESAVTVYGDAGNDTIRSGAQGGTFVGGAGTDVLYGGGLFNNFGFTDLDGNVDQIRDFDLTSFSDALIITNILTGFDEETDDINDFVLLNFKNEDRTDLFINSDGEGDDWEQAAIIRGSDFTGFSVDDLHDANIINTNLDLTL